MSDDDFTNVPPRGSSRHVTMSLPPSPPVADWPNIAVTRPNRQRALWLCLRVAGTVAIAAVFLYFCWLSSDSANRNPEILELAGPVLLLRSWITEDKLPGAVVTACLLPCIFAVGVRFNAVTLYLSVLGCVVWYMVGLFVIGMSV